MQTAQALSQSARAAAQRTARPASGVPGAEPPLPDAHTQAKFKATIETLGVPFTLEFKLVRRRLLAVQPQRCTCARAATRVQRRTGFWRLLVRARVAPVTLSALSR